MKRRQFIKNTGAFLGLMGIGNLPVHAFNSTAVKRITILHTNDVHSHIDPFPSTDARNPNQGGVARRMALIEQIKLENPHTLLFDAGDIFQGTPYFNFYGGALEFKLMSMMGYDAATIGNHDFDNGIDGLYKQLPNATFQFVSANYDFSKTVMNYHVKPYQIFVKDGVKIGVFGLGIELEGLVDKRMYKETVYYDPVGIAQDIVKKLKIEEKCDLVICLSHLGYNYQSEKVSDLKLASLTQDIDLIIGGHTHTFLKKPTVTKNAIGKNMLINQVGFAGLNLGRIDFYLDESGNVTTDSATIIV
jgi:5'-nucleotidase